MKVPRRNFLCVFALAVCAALILTATAFAQTPQISLDEIVTPSTVVMKDGHLIPFALHGFIEFKSLAEMFPYIESQTRRWPVRLGEVRRCRPHGRR